MNKYKARLQAIEKRIGSETGVQVFHHVGKRGDSIFELSLENGVITERKIPAGVFAEMQKSDAVFIFHPLKVLIPS